MIPRVRAQDISELPYVEIVPIFKDLEPNRSFPVFNTPSLILNCQRKAKFIRRAYDLISQETDEVVGTLEDGQVILNEKFLNERFLNREKVGSVQVRLVAEVSTWVESEDKQEYLPDFLKRRFETTTPQE